MCQLHTTRAEAANPPLSVRAPGESGQSGAKQVSSVQAAVFTETTESAAGVFFTICISLNFGMNVRPILLAKFAIARSGTDEASELPTPEERPSFRGVAD